MSCSMKSGDAKLSCPFAAEERRPCPQFLALHIVSALDRLVDFRLRLRLTAICEVLHAYLDSRLPMREMV
jgi:hypothetical protein